MKTLLFRFEKDIINFLECTIDSWELNIISKWKISLESITDRWEKYSGVMEEILNFKKKYSPDLFTYQSPGKYMWSIKDTEGFANSAILHLVCFQNKLELLELTPSSVREKLDMPSKEFKILLEQEKNNVISNYWIAKSDKLLDWLVSLYLLKLNL